VAQKRPKSRRSGNLNKLIIHQKKDIPLFGEGAVFRSLLCGIQDWNSLLLLRKYKQKEQPW
jgi:hypothetical protein